MADWRAVQMPDPIETLLLDAERELASGPMAGESPAAWSMRCARAQHAVLKAQIAMLREQRARERSQAPRRIECPICRDGEMPEGVYPLHMRLHAMGQVPVGEADASASEPPRKDLQSGG